MFPITVGRLREKFSVTTGQSKSVQAIQIRLTGEMANRYDVYYRAHVQDKGWLAGPAMIKLPERLGLGGSRHTQVVFLVEKGFACTRGYGVKPYSENFFQ